MSLETVPVNSPVHSGIIGTSSWGNLTSWFTDLPKSMHSMSHSGSFVVVWPWSSSPISSLQWRHSENDGVSNHQHHDSLLNRLFKAQNKKTSKLRVTGLCEGNSPVTGEFPTQRASNAGMFPFDDAIMLQCSFTGTEAIMRLWHCPWSNLEVYGKMYHTNWLFMI